MGRERKHSEGRSSHNALEHLSRGYKSQSCNIVDGTCARCRPWFGVDKDNCRHKNSILEDLNKTKKNLF